MGKEFERLLKEAMDDNNLFDDTDDITDEYEDKISDIDGDDGDDSPITITLTQGDVEVLRNILNQVDGSTDDSEDDFEEIDDSDDSEDGISDIEELEKESSEEQSSKTAVYNKHGLGERGKEADTIISHTKSGKAADNTGDLERETEVKDGEDKQYKFVKREKPSELKYPVNGKQSYK